MKVDVLDHGYIRLTETMGNDLTIVNAARVSFDKESKIFEERDAKIIAYLAKHGHTSPFRHGMLQFEVYAPLMVARQWWKYVVGSDHVMDGWNESSRRYVTEEPVFYIPSRGEWRSMPENKKQGSGDLLGEGTGKYLTDELIRYVQMGEDLYKMAQEYNVATEQARLFLPAYGMYVRWRWTASLQAVAHFVKQREGHDAQKEIQEYAKAVKNLTTLKFPISLTELLNN